jgi:CDP-diacylglycerol pyrophosphatase
MHVINRYGENERISDLNQKTGMRLLLATTQHLKHPYQVLLIPLTIYSGLEQGFLSTDYTQVQ